MNQKRFKLLKKGKKSHKPIVYWMSRDQRVRDNWALMFAQERSKKEQVPLIVLFCVIPEFLNALPRNFVFMIQGLEKIETDLNNLNISFVFLQGEPKFEIKKFINDYQIGQLITDFSPLKIKQDWLASISESLEIPIFEVDAHNIIPCWYASEKMEYSAYTFRLKIKRYLYTSLEYFPQLKRKNIKWDVNFHDKNNKSINQILNKYNTRIKAPLKFISGEDSASKSLNLFLKSKFNNYEKQRNDPTLDGQSNLSPHLHFGQISSQRVVLEFLKLKKLGDLKGSIYDEIIVRKELSDNFCYYNRLYDSFEGFPEWAKNSLNKHRMDKREYIYTLKDLECADTHDAAWNAAQVQMVKEGKMHGYMRMYWCKKILEWTESPEQALEYAQILNDKYELYGRDPNGYVGIAWSIGGVHDRAWPERNIFGKIRYMNFEGLRRKCNIQDYIDRYIY